MLVTFLSDPVTQHHSDSRFNHPFRQLMDLRDGAFSLQCSRIPRPGFGFEASGSAASRNRLGWWCLLFAGFRFAEATLEGTNNLYIDIFK